MLESDTDFRKKLETVDVEKIRDGSIADELDFVNHKVCYSSIVLMEMWYIGGEKNIGC